MGKPRITVEQFWAAATVASNGCLVWSRTRNSEGYGQVRWNDGRSCGAHRVAWQLTHGYVPPAGMHVCHRCDNPSCINPDHLFLGTPAENYRDSAAKGRRRYARTLKRRLDWDRIVALRADGLTAKAIAQLVGCSENGVFSVLKPRRGSRRHNANVAA